MNKTRINVKNATTLPLTKNAIPTMPINAMPINAMPINAMPINAMPTIPTMPTTTNAIGLAAFALFFVVSAHQLYQGADVRSGYGVWFVALTGLILFPFAWAFSIFPGAPRFSYISLAGTFGCTIAALAIVAIARYRTKSLVHKMRTDQGAKDGELTANDPERPVCIPMLKLIAVMFATTMVLTSMTLAAHLFVASYAPTNAPTNTTNSWTTWTTWLHQSAIHVYQGKNTTGTGRLLRYTGLFAIEAGIAYWIMRYFI